MKIAVAAIKQETCHFNDLQTSLEDFRNGCLKTGSELLLEPCERCVAAFMAGWRNRREREWVGVVEASPASVAGGPLSADTFMALKEMLLSWLKKAGKVEALYLSLHGAMAAENEPDTEGDMLAAARRLVGPDCFVAVTLDHHANVTRRMTEAADVMVGYETQPHDLPASGAKTARVMLDILDRRRTPRAALVKVPMLAPQDNFLTCGGPMKEWFDLAREVERDPAVMVASLFPTQPWLDVPDNGWSCLVYADTGETAQRYAEQLAQKAWDLRERFWRSERLSIVDAVKAANAEATGVVVLSDTGDAAVGGAPGDNMSIVAEMLKHDLRGPALAPVVDSAALTAALDAGVGRELTLRIGGKMSAGYSPRLDITGVVRAASGPGALLPSSGGKRVKGRTVLFERGHLKLALMELREGAIRSPLVYEQLGIDVGRAQMAVLKTGSNFQYYDDVRSALVRVDSPGATQSDLKAFAWRQRPRPLFPFEPIPDWQP